MKLSLRTLTTCFQCLLTALFVPSFCWPWIPSLPGSSCLCFVVCHQGRAMSSLCLGVCLPETDMFCCAYMSVPRSMLALALHHKNISCVLGATTKSVSHPGAPAARESGGTTMTPAAPATTPKQGKHHSIDRQLWCLLPAWHQEH